MPFSLKMNSNSEILPHALTTADFAAVLTSASECSDSRDLPIYTKNREGLLKIIERRTLDSYRLTGEYAAVVVKAFFYHVSLG